MNTLTLFEAYALARNQLETISAHIPYTPRVSELRRLRQQQERRRRQVQTFEARVRARLTSTRHIELSGRVPEFFASYNAMNAEGKHLANDAQVMRWREECRSYAVNIVGALLLTNPQLREVKP